MFVGGYQGEHGQEEAAAAAAAIKAQPPLLSLQVQGSQLNMAVFFLYLVKSDLYATVHVYTGRLSFTRYQKHTDIVNWSLCSSTLYIIPTPVVRKS